VVGREVRLGGDGQEVEGVLLALVLGAELGGGDLLHYSGVHPEVKSSDVYNYKATFVKGVNRPINYKEELDQDVSTDQIRIAANQVCVAATEIYKQNRLAANRIPLAANKITNTNNINQPTKMKLRQSTLNKFVRLPNSSEGSSSSDYEESEEE